MARGKVVEVKLYSRNKEKSIVIEATVVKEIMHLPIKNEDRFNQLIKSSAEALKHIKNVTAVTEDNFQQVPGGKIQILIGQNIGQDFLPIGSVH